MNQRVTELKEVRLEKLFADCREQVISQIIGPFGLSMAMFEDKNGGNVTTLHNFSRDDDSFVATESDRALHQNSKNDYNRSEYENNTRSGVKMPSDERWDKKRMGKIEQGIDEYTGKPISPEAKIELADGRIVGAELDHVVSLSELHNNPKMHLALGKTSKDEETGNLSVDVERIRKIGNSDENLAITNASLNRSKKDLDLKDWSEKERADGTSNTEKFELDDQRVNEKYKNATDHINNAADSALFKKQATELLKTGGKQAALMGVRQALGVLLVELVNGLFNEFKEVVAQGAEISKSLLDEIRERLAHVIKSVVKKIPDAIGQMFQGGLSGFMSNLLTFLINSFLSTAKRFTTVIREGLLGLFRAFKMIFFPPKGMTGDQALQEGLKILTAVVTASVGILLTEAVSTFMMTLPFLAPFAELISPVLIGILSGLLSAFLAYQIDCLFDRYRNSLSEKLMDELIMDVGRRDEFANELCLLTTASLDNINNYTKSSVIYQNIGATLGATGTAAAVTLISLEQAIAETANQVEKSFAMIGFINESQQEIENFLKTL